METKKEYNYLQYECSTPVYTQPEVETRLEYENYQNVNYEVIVKKPTPVEQGYSFRELLARSFSVEDVNVNKNFKYGLGKVLQPKTQTINDMKKTIDEATELLDQITLNPVDEPVVESNNTDNGKEDSNVK
nr:MAG: hypothetical protein [Microvirus Sku211]